jgi:hypothetical protein
MSHLNVNVLRRERGRIAKLRDDASPCHGVTDPTWSDCVGTGGRTCPNCQTYGSYAAMVTAIDKIIKETR